MLAILYFVLLIYLVFLFPGRSNLGTQAMVIHTLPFTNFLHSFERLTNNHPPLSIFFFFSANLLGNVLLFLPLPPMLYYTFSVRNRRLLIGSGAALSLGIESLQYCFEIGVPDVDDLILNTTGCLAGVYLHSIFLENNRNCKSKTHENRPHKV